MEKWIVHPGETRVIDLESVRELKVGLVGGQIDVIAHDEPSARIEVHGVTVKDLRIEMNDGRLEIDHPQLRWDNFLEVFRNFGAGGPRAEVSVAVPRAVALTLGVVSASALVSGLRTDARLNTVSGDIIVDGLVGDVTVTGAVTKASIDTVSGAMLVDSTGPVQSIALNSVNGAATIRLDRGLPANYVSRSVSGRVQIDGHVRSGSGPTNFTGSTGALAGQFVDVRANTVSGEITVLRRGISGLRPEELANEEEW